MTTTNPKQPAKHALAAAWRHLDSICVGNGPTERNLLTLAQQETESVIDALMTPGPVDRNDLAARLESAVNKLRLAGGHLDDVVLALGESATA